MAWYFVLLDEVLLPRLESLRVGIAKVAGVLEALSSFSVNVKETSVMMLFLQKNL